MKTGDTAARFLHHSLPKRLGMWIENQLLVVIENKPAVMPDLVLKLPRPPSGIADEYAQIGGGLVVKSAADRGIRRQKIEIPGDRPRGARRLSFRSLPQQRRRQFRGTAVTDGI